MGIFDICKSGWVYMKLEELFLGGDMKFSVFWNFYYYESYLGINILLKKFLDNFRLLSFIYLFRFLRNGDILKPTVILSFFTCKNLRLY